MPKGSVQKRKRPAKSTTVRSVARHPAGAVKLVTLSDSFALKNPERLSAMAMYWSYVASNQQRFTSESKLELRKRLTMELQDVGIREKELRALAQHDIVEVHVPFTRERDLWAARIMPWELLLTLATRPFRSSRALTMIRHLYRVDQPKPTPPSPPQRLLLVLSEPGPVAGQYGFRAEADLVRSILGSKLTEQFVADPTRPQFIQVIEQHCPDVVHLMGVEGNAVREAAKEQFAAFTEDGRVRDGLVLRGEDTDFDYLEAEPLAKALCGADKCPVLISFSFCHTAARLAALAVAYGAHHAIGFQDWIDDAGAALFFGRFYAVWREGWDVLKAFESARLALRNDPNASRSGYSAVLWSDRSLIAERRIAAPPSGAAGTETPVSLSTEIIPRAPGAVPFTVTIEAHPRLNYSVLQNRGGLFKTFLLTNTSTATIQTIEIHAELAAGEISFPYRCVRNLTPEESPCNLNLDLHVPLTAALLRQAREEIQTSLFVEVIWQRQVVRRETFRVALLSADEWVDDEVDRCWLPSFVLPRDPAVHRIVHAAQRYIRALVDDGGAGFDGYQQLDAEGNDPFGVVDLQVRAIWAALVHDFALGYINPPPTYTAASQRIRSPSQVLEEKRGTCLDLAVLFAGCLEWIGLYPVLFLIQGHAFPGYWRSEQAHGDLMNFTKVAPSATAPSEATSGISISPGQKKKWMLGTAAALREILGPIQEGKLAPVETTLLARNGSFAQALEEGLKNLQDPRLFDAFLDVNIARGEGVTPLPLSGLRV